MSHIVELHSTTMHLKTNLHFFFLELCIHSNSLIFKQLSINDGFPAYDLTGKAEAVAHTSFTHRDNSMGKFQPSGSLRPSDIHIRL